MKLRGLKTFGFIRKELLTGGLHPVADSHTVFGTRNKTIKAISLFVLNPKHTSLNFEKLKGSEVWTIRIDKSNRIFFYWIDDFTALFIDIGKHDKYRKY